MREIIVFNAKDLTTSNILVNEYDTVRSRSIITGWEDHDTPIIGEQSHVIHCTNVDIIHPDEIYYYSRPRGCLLLGVSRVVECCPDSYTLLVTNPTSIQALRLFDRFKGSILKITDSEYLVRVSIDCTTTIWNADRTESLKDVITTASCITPLIYPKHKDGVLQWILYQGMVKRLTTEPVPVLPVMAPVPVYEPFTFPPHVEPPRPPPSPHYYCIGGVKNAILLTDVCCISHAVLTLETAYRTQCKHFYDRDEIWTWWKIKKGKECPYCKAIEPFCPCPSCIKLSNVDSYTENVYSYTGNIDPPDDTDEDYDMDLYSDTEED
jgi:hypothetical protein